MSQIQIAGELLLEKDAELRRLRANDVAKDARIAELEQELSAFRELVGGTDDTTTMTRKSFVEVLQALSDTKAKLDRAEGEAKGLKAIIKTAEKDRDMWCMQTSAKDARIAELEAHVIDLEEIVKGVHFLRKQAEKRVAELEEEARQYSNSARSENVALRAEIEACARSLIRPALLRSWRRPQPRPCASASGSWRSSATE